MTDEREKVDAHKIQIVGLDEILADQGVDIDNGSKKASLNIKDIMSSEKRTISEHQKLL